MNEENQGGFLSAALDSAKAVSGPLRSAASKLARVAVLLLATLGVLDLGLQSEKSDLHLSFSEEGGAISVDVELNRDSRTLPDNKLSDEDLALVHKLFHKALENGLDRAHGEGAAEDRTARPEDHLPIEWPHNQPTNPIGK